MMQQYAVRHSFSKVERGAMDEIGQSLAMTWLRERKNESIPKSLSAISPKLLLMSATAPEGDSPEILFVGRDSMCAHVMPASTDTDQHQPKQLFDDHFRSSVHKGYHISIDGEPCFETISSKLKRSDGTIFELFYERLILLWHLSSGINQLTTYVKPLEVRLLTDLPNPGPNCGDLHPLPSSGLLWQAPAPIQSLSDALPKSHRPSDSAWTNDLV